LMADDAYEELSRRLAMLVAKLDSTYDELLEANRAQREFNQEQREFNRRQVEINARLEITQARIETLLAHLTQQSDNGRNATVCTCGERSTEVGMISSCKRGVCAQATPMAAIIRRTKASRAGSLGINIMPLYVMGYRGCPLSLLSLLMSRAVSRIFSGDLESNSLATQW